MSTGSWDTVSKRTKVSVWGKPTFTASFRCSEPFIDLFINGRYPRSINILQWAILLHSYLMRLIMHSSLTIQRRHCVIRVFLLSNRSKTKSHGCKSTETLPQSLSLDKPTCIAWTIISQKLLWLNLLNAMVVSSSSSTGEPTQRSAAQQREMSKQLALDATYVFVFCQLLLRGTAPYSKAC